jgi:glutathione S-transferase
MVPLTEAGGTMHRLYDSAISGNAYKVRLLLTHLDIAFERIEMNVDDGSTRKPEFLEINPNGKVPALQFPDGRVLFESNAILFYLALNTPYWPADPWHQGQAVQWMNFEQYSHEPTVAVVRHWVAHLGKTPQNEPQLAGKIAGGDRALDVMEGHLRAHRWFAGNAYSIADIALYAYTHVAGEGGFDLQRRPAIRDWLGRVVAQPKHVKITD